jgi:tetratricopeptide (TPR) repeat protein
MNYESKDIIELFCAIFGVLATVAGTMWAIIKATKRYFENKKIELNTYYIARGVFSDRLGSLNELQRAVNSNARIINVYGKRGIGKSAFLRFFCDSVNHKLNRLNKKTRKKLKIGKGIATYIELSSYGNASIVEQILNTVATKDVTFAQYIDELLSKTLRKKKIYIVLDNVNTNALGKEIETVVDILFSHSPKFCVIVGSIEKQPFINSINENIIKYVQLNTFDENDIFDFAENNNCDIPPNMIQKVLSFSEGLPIFVSLFLKNNEEYLSCSSERIDKYLERIFDDLSSQSKQIALFIAFLSITNAIIKFQLLQHFMCSISENDLEELENSSLIEYDKANANIKMHELFRNYIVKKCNNEKDIIGLIYNYYNNDNKIFEKTYYLLMLNYENRNSEIIRVIEKAIDGEKYSFLLLLGEHYKLLYDWNNQRSGIESKTFLYVIYGYVSGLIGVGNYPAAREVIDTCRISANNLETILQFRFSLLTAQLYHLQNEYDLSIETYNILLNNIGENELFQKYEAKCLWGIAHSLRHKGYDLDGAIDYYDRSIETAIRLGRESEVLKSMMEKLNIYMLQNKVENARELHNEIVRRIHNLPSGMYKGTKNSFNKLESRYVRIMLNTNIELQFNLLQKTLNEYKNQKKRLQYNTYFEFGEYYRKLERYEKAKEHYNKALAFSKQNNDYNLKTLSQIALIVLDISIGNYVSEQLIPTIIETIRESETKNLYTNKLLAEMILSFLQNETPDASVLSEFIRLAYISAVDVYNENSYIAYKGLNLFLM